MRFAACLAGLVFALFARYTVADESCRIAFDMGSSGIRAGAAGSDLTTRAEIDFLSPLWAGRGLEEVVAPTIAALNELPAKAGFPADCARVGGGFSAWRLASEKDAASLVNILRRIRSEAGVAVLVMPQLREGAYGYFGARKLLGERLTTSHILDVGGGSLQVAGERSAFGEALGQKIWQRYLCQEIRNAETSPCGLQPLTRDEVAAARGLLQKKLGGMQQALPEPVTMTAISRPVSRGVLPAVRRLSGSGSVNQFTRADLAAAIDRIADLSIQETAVLVGSPASYVAYLLSDMLLVEGLMQATNSDLMQVAEIDLTNLPGLLADDKAFEWAGRYDCYLTRLRTSGAAAYGSDLTTCPAP
jgi:hypothetical protein